VTPLHFIDAVALTRPDVIAKGIDAIVAELLAFKARREHAHVWDSEAFRRLLLAAPGLIERPFEIVCEVEGDVTFFEYFAILQLG
jgi:hypothetical protein